MAAGVLADAGGEILVARRSDHAHQGGLWEFPGGKLEAGEDIRSGLARELAEEIGIRVTSARPTTASMRPQLASLAYMAVMTSGE